MNAYAPASAVSVVTAFGIWAILITAGYLLNRVGTQKWLRLVAWAITIAAVIAVERLCRFEPTGMRMLAIVATLLYGMKCVVAVESRIGGKAPLRVPQWLVFSCLWFGMRPSVFRKYPGPPREGSRQFFVSGAMTAAIGLALSIAARFISSDSQFPEPQALAALIVLMIGLSFTVHFGLFDLLTGTWRSLGADCPKLFRSPIRSKSLTEFWSRRWNIAFSEMAALAVFRPTKSWLGSGGAKTVAFLFSGFVHELAISFPVQAGYGLPMCYFTLHAVAMRLETTPLLRRWLQSRLFAHIWTVAWVVLPLPLLFHRAFCEGVLLPLL